MCHVRATSFVICCRMFAKRGMSLQGLAVGKRTVPRSVDALAPTALLSKDTGEHLAESFAISMLSYVCSILQLSAAEFKPCPLGLMPPT